MSPTLETLFAFLFKYRPFLFHKGHFVMALAWPAVVALLVGALAVAGSYARARGASGRERATLATLRTAVLALVLFCLSRPALVLSTVVPQQSFLGVLVDDSESMKIADDGEARGAFATRTFGPGSALTRALADRYKLRYFRFS